MGGGAERFSSSVVCARMECIGHQSRFVRLRQICVRLIEADKTALMSDTLHTSADHRGREALRRYRSGIGRCLFLSRCPGQNGNVSPAL